MAARKVSIWVGAWLVGAGAIGVFLSQRSSAPGPFPAELLASRKPIQFNLPAVSGGEAIIRYSEQAGVLTVFDSPDLQSVTFAAVHGQMTRREALNRRLVGTPCRAIDLPGSTVLVACDP